MRSSQQLAGDSSYLGLDAAFFIKIDFGHQKNIQYAMKLPFSTCGTPPPKKKKKKKKQKKVSPCTC